MLLVRSHYHFMREALREALKAYAKNESPVGAVVVKDGRIIGRGHNLRENAHDPTLHAELIAIREAAHALNDWRLENCVLYVTLEPCMMCAGAIYQSRISNLYFATRDPKAGVIVSKETLLTKEWLNHYTVIEEGLFEKTSSRILKRFFSKLRENNKRVE